MSAEQLQRRVTSGPDILVQPRPRLFAFAADGAALFLLLALVALFFWRLWAPNPADRLAFPTGDFTDQYYPLRRFVAASFAEGHLPFWNPFIFGGQPGLADPQAAALYPPAVLNALLWGADFPLIALELEVVAHIVLAAWGAYAFARAALCLNTLPSFLAAGIFALGGYLTGFPVQQVTILETAAWLPWLLLAIHFAGPAPTQSLHRRIFWSAIAGIFLAFALLAGHPQTALYIVYTSAAYVLFKLWQQRPKPHQWVVVAFPLLAPFGLAVGLASAQLLPTAAFIAESSRQLLDYNFARSGLTWEGLMTLFLPQVFGFNPLYVSVAALFLVPLGLVSHRQRAEKCFWGGAALLSLLLSLGGNSPLFDLFYLGLPGFEQIRSQERVLLIWTWSLALLAGWGAAALADENIRVRLRPVVRWLALWIPVLLLPLLAFWWLRGLAFAQLSINVDAILVYFERYTAFFVLFVLVWALFAWYVRHRGPRVTTVLVLLGALLLFDLFTVNRFPNLGKPPAEALPARTEVVEALSAAQETNPARVAIVGAPRPAGNDGMIWGFPLLSGNEPLRLANTEHFLHSVPAWRQIQQFSAPYIVADNDLATADPNAYELLAAAPNGSYLLRVRPEMPYAWVVNQIETLPNLDAIYPRLQQPDFDPHTIALIEAPLARSTGGVAADVQLLVVGREPGSSQFQITNRSGQPVLLLIAEPVAAGWQTFIDGARAEWQRANALNVAVPVPPGEHAVTLRYEQPGWRAGLLISAVSLMTTLAVLVWGAWGSAQRRNTER